MPLDVADKVAIHDLMVRYTFAVDSKAGVPAFQALFTDDAAINGPFGAFTGRQGVSEFSERVASRDQVQLRHVMSNVLIDGDDDRATVKAYFVEYMTMLEPVPPRPNRSTERIFVGTYQCRVRRVDGYWLMQERTVHFDAP